MRQLCSYKLLGSTQWAVICFIVIETISWHVQHFSNLLQFGKWEFLKRLKRRDECLCYSLWSFCIKKAFLKGPNPPAQILPNSCFTLKCPVLLSQIQSDKRPLLCHLHVYTTPWWEVRPDAYLKVSQPALQLVWNLFLRLLGKLFNSMSALCRDSRGGCKVSIYSFLQIRLVPPTKHGWVPDCIVKNDLCSQQKLTHCS